MFRSVRQNYWKFKFELESSEYNFPNLSLLRNHPIRTFSRIQLLRAAAQGDIAKIEFLLKNKTNVDAKRNAALHFAGILGHFRDFNLEKYEPTYNTTPLHFACLNGHLEVAKLIVRNGADIEAEDYYGFSALHLASGNGQKSVVEFLTRSGANSNARNAFDVTPLHFAAEEGHLDVLQYLISNGAYFNARTKTFSVPGENFLFVQNWTPLICSINNNRFDVMKILLEIAVSVNSNYIDSLINAEPEAFCIAVEFLISMDNHEKQVEFHNFQEILELLVEKSNELGHRRITLFELLIKKGVDINFRYIYGKTALHYAVINEKFDMVKLLLKYNADVNSVDDNQYTPLHCTLIPAIAHGSYFLSIKDTSYADILLEHGCSRTTTLNCLNPPIQGIECTSLKQVILYHVLNYPEERKPYDLSLKLVWSMEFNIIISLSEFWDSCLLEIKQMKKNYISNRSNIYTVCVERNLNKLASYTTNKSFDSYCKTHAYKYEYPIYGDLILKRFKRGKRMEELISKLKKLQISSKAQIHTEKLIFLNLDCLLLVAQYLSDIDLISLMKSSICVFCSLSKTKSSQQS